jgi:hypothetical protein
MRVQTEEWRRFIPGVRMYKGKKTLFWNGEKLREQNARYLIYDEEERQTWQVIIVLPGVEVIPWYTFDGCDNVKTVIMSDSVKRIEGQTFGGCRNLEYVKLSKSLEYIGYSAFDCCFSLTSIFIPASCREIGNFAFDNTNLIILHVPQHTTLGRNVIKDTPLFRASPFEDNEDGYYRKPEIVNQWIKNVNSLNDEFDLHLSEQYYDEVTDFIGPFNQDEKLALHRECASFEPSEDSIYAIFKRQVYSSIHIKNKIGLTAFEYLEKNPYTEITEQKLINRYVLDLMGEIIT